MKNETYPNLNRIAKDTPNTVIDSNWEDYLSEKTLAELKQLTRFETYEEINDAYEGYTVEELLGLGLNRLAIAEEKLNSLSKQDRDELEDIALENGILVVYSDDNYTEDFLVWIYERFKSLSIEEQIKFIKENPEFGDDNNDRVNFESYLIDNYSEEDLNKYKAEVGFTIVNGSPIY